MLLDLRLLVRLNLHTVTWLAAQEERDSGFEEPAARLGPERTGVGVVRTISQPVALIVMPVSLSSCAGFGLGLWVFILGGLLFAVGSSVTAGKLEEGDPGNEG